MKFSLLQPAHNSRRASLLRTTSADAVSSFQTAADSSRPSPSSSSLSLPPLFLLLLHCLCCLFSLLLGFCFSRVVFFLLFSSPAAAAAYTSAPVLRSTTTTTTTTLTTLTTTTSTTLTTLTETVTVPVVDRTPSPNHNSSGGGGGAFAGRRGIRIRPWPHPNPAETMRAHRIVELVQREQLRRQHGARSARRAIVVTPTHVRALQAPHLTGLMHSLMLVPYDLTWIVVEAGGVSAETASIFAKSNLDVLHIPFAVEKTMPADWSDRRRMEARMRLHALRVVREQRMDGIVLFADDSNIHSTDLFDEIQKVKWMGALSVGVLAHPVGYSTPPPNRLRPAGEADNGSLPVPIQGPACDASGRFTGWHAFDPATNSVDFVARRGERTSPAPRLEWSGFVLNSRLLWRETEGRPDWFRSLGDGEQIDSPLGLLKEASFVEPLGNCGKKVMLWWLRAEAHPDSKFPPGWIIEPSVENKYMDK
ncbi:glycosyltransferase [Iris pallida]|uniref:Glycosyltransferases n=1 Tax=Iris pallida TaxID=29817 RepID=A0AAX6IAV8_IRIPA|nr:glycosyltransferase [Iris pallida]